MRPVIKAYEGKNIPIEYGKQEAESKRRFIEEWRKSGKSNHGSGLTLSGLFGASQSNVSTHFLIDDAFPFAFDMRC